MTAIALEDRGHAATRTVVVGLGLGLAVAVRWQIFRTEALDGVTEGLVFGLALLALAGLGGLKVSVPPVQAVAAGLAAGAILVAAAILSRWPIPPLVLGHAAPFLPWVVVTTLVATAEELVLRGTLWRWAAAAGGDASALVATSLLFALIHVPVYGPTVVPLDFGVGLLFGGLRLWFGGPAAPAAAHVLADLATWWL
ncbi:MAG: CPBP family intramembrane glutamic endopeptidase [Candidatus Limnocylindrales bacterium]